VRVAAQLYLVAVVVRDILRPEHDPVRTTVVEQGGGGPRAGPRAEVASPVS